MEEPAGNATAEVGRFYDALRARGPSADHMESGPPPEDQRGRFYARWRFAGLETPRSYLEALRAAGLELLAHEETSVYAVRFYTRLLEGYVAEQAQFESIRGPERYPEDLSACR